jgi:hypothetical protein
VAFDNNRLRMIIVCCCVDAKRRAERREERKTCQTKNRLIQRSNRRKNHKNHNTTLMHGIGARKRSKIGVNASIKVIFGAFLLFRYEFVFVFVVFFCCRRLPLTILLLIDDICRNDLCNLYCSKW